MRLSGLTVYVWMMLACFSACESWEQHKRILIMRGLGCKHGGMQEAEYMRGMDEAIPLAYQAGDSFVVVVDTGNYAVNFISDREQYCLWQAATFGASNSIEVEGWNQMSRSEKDTLLVRTKRKFQEEAAAIHRYQNNRKRQVWLINLSTEPVSVQLQDGYYFCILEAQTPIGLWQPIEYMRLSKCAGSFYIKQIPPNMANSFVFDLPQAGEYATNLRFKLLAADRFFFSNSFPGRIDLCQFISVDPLEELGVPPQLFRIYTLDSLVWFPRW